MRFVLTALVSWIAVGAFLSISKQRGWGQAVRRDGPVTHLLKDGTPTMGGVPFGLVIFLAWLAFVGLVGASDSKGWAVIGLAFGMYLIGSWDDILNIRSRMQNKGRGGLLAREKFPAQILVAGLFAYVVAADVPLLGSFWLDVVFYAGIAVGTANAINFSDGLDGLCAGTVAIILLPLIGLSPLAGLTVAALMGYLWFNAPKAQIFMGDAGSHALGGIVAGVYITQGWTWVLPLAAIFPVCATVSVMIQVPYFQYTKRKYGQGRRIFLMTPIHHHFEKLGWTEVKVTGRFLAITAVATMLAWSIMSGGKL
ncbi:MAG: phospho-N-acetylmuramoyl-pentapeptide-transferase [Deinococcales bacterium]